MGLRVLNVGCGKKKREFPEAGDATEIVGIDISPQSEAEIIHDLDATPWPIESDRFDLIIMQDVLEHLERVPAVLNEVWRVAAPNGRVRIRTPHYSSYYAYNDPTHKRFFGIYVLDGFLVDTHNDLYAEGKFRLVTREIIFSRMMRYLGIAWFANTFSHRWEKLLAFVWRADNMFFELEAVKSERGQGSGVGVQGSSKIPASS